MKHYCYYYQQNMWLLLLLLVAVIVGSGDGAGEDLTQKCGQVVQKVIPCLNYATGKASTPSKECCEAATKIRESDPDCLCFIIQQTHHGNPESKSLGIQEDKLLHLPSLCNVKNANIADCPSSEIDFRIKSQRVARLNLFASLKDFVFYDQVCCGNSYMSSCLCSRHEQQSTHNITSNTLSSCNYNACSICVFSFGDQQ